MKLTEKVRIIKRERLHDQRGWFLKIITGKEEFIPEYTGEVYIVSANPGESRANHYHMKTCEWFSLIMGKAKLILEDTESKERIVIDLDSDNPQTIYVPNKIAHSFKNISQEPFLLVAYSNTSFNISDTYPYAL